MLPSLTKTEILILTAVCSTERYGLEIVDRVKEISAGKTTLSLGGLYTTLHRMEEKGLVVARWGETDEIRRGARRKYYKTTGLGLRALREVKTAMDYVKHLPQLAYVGAR